MRVNDADGDAREMAEDEVEVLERSGRALTCPNNEDDLSAGYHAHVHTTWAVFDAAQRCSERHPGEAHEAWAVLARAYVDAVVAGANMGFGSATKAIDANSHLLEVDNAARL